MEDIVQLAPEVEPLLFYGINNSNMRLLKDMYPGIKVMARGRVIKISSEALDLTPLREVLQQMQEVCVRSNKLDTEMVLKMIKGHEVILPTSDNLIVHGVNGKIIAARTSNQKAFVEAFEHNDLMFAIGPAGSGKTYTAIALAVKLLKTKQVKKIILSRPAVEAGEKLGFLPGDMKEKIDPYLQPLYDALEDMVPGSKLADYLENKIVQIAPLAFMRGRTLNDAVVILDEAQNTSVAQIKMFMTRMGLGCKMIITGDITQIDLPPSQTSGLKDAVSKLHGIRGIKIIRFDETDILRHPLVKKIVKAYTKPCEDVRKADTNTQKKGILLS